MTWKESNHFLCWYSYQQFDFLAVTFLQVNFAELTVSKLFYNPQHNSNLSKIRNKHKEYNFACKKKSKYCYNILQQETAWHQGARKHQWRGEVGGERYCTNSASDFNKHQKCFLQKPWQLIDICILGLAIFFLWGNYHMTYVVIWSEYDDDEPDKWWWWW